MADRDHGVASATEAASDAPSERAGVVLSVDAMSGDHGPEIAVEGLKRADLDGVRAILHGDAAQLFDLTAKFDIDPKLIEIRHADSVIGMEVTPREALRQGAASSMSRAIETLACGEADAIVSAGNTAAMVAMATLRLKTSAGVERPAIAALWPSLSPNRFNVVLDVGATLGADAEALSHHAGMGIEYARIALGVERPRVALLNVGAEETKGQTALRDAAALLKRAAEEDALDADFVGFVEGDRIGGNEADVIVTDGFTGNIALKTAEGAARQIGNYMRLALSESVMVRLGALLAAPALAKLKRRIDPRRVNGGVLLGLNGVVVKSHGGSDALGFAAALNLAARMGRRKLGDAIVARLAKLARDPKDRPEASVAL